MHLKAILIFVVIASVHAVSQEIRTIDLTGVTQPALPFPRDTTIKSLSCGPEAKTTSRARASLEWLETTDIYPKQRIAMLVKIENVGKSPINLPVKPRLEDVQPKGSSSRFEYYSLTLPLMAGFRVERLN